MRRSDLKQFLLSVTATSTLVCATGAAYADDAAIAAGAQGFAAASSINGRTGATTYVPGSQATHYVQSPNRQKAAVTTPTQRAVQSSGSGQKGSYSRSAYWAAGVGGGTSGQYTSSQTGTTYNTSIVVTPDGAAGSVTTSGGSASNGSTTPAY